MIQCSRQVSLYPDTPNIDSFLLQGPYGRTDLASRAWRELHAGMTSEFVTASELRWFRKFSIFVLAQIAYNVSLRGSLFESLKEVTVFHPGKMKMSVFWRLPSALSSSGNPRVLRCNDATCFSANPSSRGANRHAVHTSEMSPLEAESSWVGLEFRFDEA